MAKGKVVGNLYIMEDFTDGLEVEFYRMSKDSRGGKPRYTTPTEYNQDDLILDDVLVITVNRKSTNGKAKPKVKRRPKVAKK